ncbi:quinone oxidoreductase [Pseudomonas sp. CBSPBW29]|uniref:quinone oxidoreductase family protein n=1 Tax=Pseudomonas TaxID=286 RepID=UPI0021AD09A5|nr:MULTISPECIES: quinone oxidoreductase [unclassified Pseudomonas]WEL42935.1 quinone oxidoreductase [Pseudomonas sp. CBSPBW29]WEL67904.1 quinone oxidoreductase [Pseudomonas sp. CBSPGW29]WEL73193.1 quinone oxidoreductase [Pseudomonas sp. CBSPCGW29]WEL74503.1 quinone oxidoreductase [Pseudomonas sp. CBSPAW29]WEL81257.1 quinone oxidoreductase [Pseudomonas sp. CBSPCAW29]WEL91303.1 quinone oxidoreductase [Pseudomonas sp. CBSPCBW29]
MKALTLETYGGPEVVQLRLDVPKPQVTAGHVLVKVACAGINFMDVHTRQGKYAKSVTYPVRLPCTLGMEGAGVVVAVGEGVSHLAPGDRVAWCIAWGAFAEYANVPAARVAQIPNAIGFDQAAAAMFQGCTAHYLIEDVARLQTGNRCLIHAASGSIGQLLVQMAHRLGATVFTTGSSTEKCAIALQRGADHAWPYDGFAERVLQVTQGRGVDVVFDSVGKATLRESFRACRTRGLIVNYGNVSGSITDLDPMELGEAGSLFLTRPRLNDHMADGPTVQRRANAVFAAMLEGSLTVDIEGHYALEEVHQVHARIEARQQIGKAVVWLD